MDIRAIFRMAKTPGASSGAKRAKAGSTTQGVGKCGFPRGAWEQGTLCVGSRELKKSFQGNGWKSLEGVICGINHDANRFQGGDT
jgi:hypothetical protein